MIIPRLIPILLMKGYGLVKTVNFKTPNYIGDPINAVKIFNDKEVDELILFDISASIGNRSPQYSIISDIISESFMPLGYGGGLKEIDQIKKIIDMGIEKIVLNSSSLNYSLIEQAANLLGSQSVVICIDVKKTIMGRYNIYTQSGTINHKIPVDIFASEVINVGAGEIIIQSIDREGTMKGIDLDLVKLISDKVNVPVVASGGVGSLDHIREAIMLGGSSAVAAGSFFVYKGKNKAILINYPKYEIIKELFN